MKSTPPKSTTAETVNALQRAPEFRTSWFAARPSGTENIYKIYAESFRGTAPLDALVSEAEALVNPARGGRP